MIKICYISKRDMDQSILDIILQSPGLDLVINLYITDNTAELVGALDSDIIALDTDGLDESAVSETAHNCRVTVPDKKIIVLTDREDDLFLFALLDNEIDSLIVKGDQLENELPETLRRVMDNQYIIPSKITGLLLRRILNMKMTALDVFSTRLQENNLLLTGRETEIAYLMRLGLKNKEIAHRLRMNEAAVKVHVSRIYKKTKAPQRKGLIRKLNQIFPSS